MEPYSEVFVGERNRAPTADNMRDKDARHLYIWMSLHGAYIRYPVEGTRRDFVSRDVKRHGRGRDS